MRKSSIFLVSVAVGLLLLLGLILHGEQVRDERKVVMQKKRELVKVLGLTDLCVFTDARYARHPSMADLHTPFQDYPLSFEHFPSGSILSVPPHLMPSESRHETIH